MTFNRKHFDRVCLVALLASFGASSFGTYLPWYEPGDPAWRRALDLAIIPLLVWPLQWARTKLPEAPSGPDQ